MNVDAVLICLLNSVLQKHFIDTLPLKLAGSFPLTFNRKVIREQDYIPIITQHTFPALLKAKEEKYQH